MRQGYTVFAAIVVSALAATPLVMSAGKALATSDRSDAVTQSVAVTPVEVALVAAPAAPETCTRKVRVVYSGYGTAPTACAANR